MKPSLYGAVVLCSLYFAGHVLAQSDDDYPQPTPPPNTVVPPSVQRAATAATIVATMTVNLPSGQVQKEVRGGVTDPLTLLPGQPVDITVNLPASSAGHTVTVDSLDAGRVLGNGNQLVVATDGSVAFKFKPGDTPGVNRISLRDSGREIGLQFWILDQSNPSNNPASPKAAN